MGRKKSTTSLELEETSAYQEIVTKSLNAILDLGELSELPESSKYYTIQLKKKKKRKLPLR